MSTKNTKIKFKTGKDNEEQRNLGADVLVNAFKSKCKYRTTAIAKALKKLDVRDIAKLPMPKTLERHLGILQKAIDEKKRPEDGTHGWEIVIQMAYDKLTNNQVSVNDIKAENAEKKVTVPEVCPQEDLMEQDAERASKEEQEEKEAPEAPEEDDDDIPFCDLPEDFDIWQSDAYSFLTAFCSYCPDGEGTVTMNLKTFEMLFRRQYGRRGIA